MIILILNIIKIVVFFWGDPHIQTLDELDYTFNGLGEYWMVKSESFELQARTERAWDSNKQPSTAGTVFGAVAGRAFYEQSNETVSTSRVHVEMTADRTTGTFRQLSVLSQYTLGLCIAICMSLYTHLPAAIADITHSNILPRCDLDIDFSTFKI